MFLSHFVCPLLKVRTPNYGYLLSQCSPNPNILYTSKGNVILSTLNQQSVFVSHILYQDPSPSWCTQFKAIVSKCLTWLDSWVYSNLTHPTVTEPKYLVRNPYLLLIVGASMFLGHFLCPLLKVRTPNYGYLFSHFSPQTISCLDSQTCL